MPVTEVLPDDATLRRARLDRVLAAMEADGVDVLVAGREANARYVAGAPRLWLAGSKPFGVGCVLVRETRSVHLLSTWDEGIPDDIPHEHLYGISFNAQNFLKVLQGIDGAASVEVVATDALTPGAARLLPKAFPSAELVDGEQLMRGVRTVKLPEEVEAIRASVGIAERSLAAAESALAPGITERQLTGIFMEAMASAAVTTPASQDVAWITSRDQPWQRTSRDAPVAAGDVVAFEGGVVAGGYIGELGRTHVADGDGTVAGALFARADELSDALLAACRPGMPQQALVEAYDEVGVPPPPVPVARGLGLGFDLPLVTSAMPRTATESPLEAGMVLALASYVWEQGVGAVYGLEPVVLTPTGPELLSTTPFREPGSTRT